VSNQISVSGVKELSSAPHRDTTANIKRIVQQVDLSITGQLPSSGGNVIVEVDFSRGKVITNFQSVYPQPAAISDCRTLNSLVSAAQAVACIIY